jgi:ribosome-associated protein
VPARKAAVAVARALDALKAEDIVVLDVDAVSTVTEVFLLASASNPRHVRALAEQAEKTMREEIGVRPAGREGIEEGRWAVLDYGPLVVHLFQPSARKYYDLEVLWGDGAKIRWKPPAAKAAGSAEPAAKAPAAKKAAKRPRP